MADIDRYMKALRKADEQGNVEDARYLAKRIKELQAQSTKDSSKPQEEDSSEWENFKSSVKAGLHTAKSGWDLLAGGLAGIVGNEADRDKIFEEAVKQQETAKAQTKGGVGGTVGSIVGSIPGIITGPASGALETYRTLDENPKISSDLKIKAARKEALLSAATNMYGLVPGASLAGTLGRAGAATLIHSLGSDENKMITAMQAGETSEEARKYLKDPSEYAKEVAMGTAAILGMHGAAKVTGKAINSVLPKKEGFLTPEEQARLLQDVKTTGDKVYDDTIHQQDIQLPQDTPEGFVSPYGNLEHTGAVDENGMPISAAQDTYNSQMTVGDIADNIRAEQQAQPTVLPEGFQNERPLPLRDGTEGKVSYDPETNVIVAHNADGEIIGTARPSHRPGTLGDNERASIDVIQTNPEYKGQGVATQMGQVFKDLFGEDNIEPSKIKTDEGLQFANSFWGTKQRGAIKFFERGAKKTADDLNLRSGETTVGKALNYARLVSQDVPWTAETRDRFLQPGRETGYSESGNRATTTLMSNRQSAMLKDSAPLKWGTDQLNIAMGKTREFMNGLLYGSEAAFGKGLRPKGMPSTIDTEAGSLTSLQKLSQKDLNSLAITAHALDQQALPRRVTGEELSTLGLSKEAQGALQKFWKNNDAMLGKVNSLLKALGRDDEMIQGRNHFAMAKREGQWQLPIYDNEGNVKAVFDFDSKAEYQANKQNINNLLEQNGYDTNKLTWSDGMLAPLTEKFSLPAGEQYFNKNGIYIGTGAKAHFTPKKGILGARGSYGEDAGKHFIEAYQSYADRMQKLIARLDMQARLKPMMEDPEINANYKVTKDRLTRELNTFTGGGKSLDNPITSLERAVKSYTREYTGGKGFDISDVIDLHTGIFYANKIIGGPVKFVYDNFIQYPLSAVPRMSYLKNALGSEGSLTMAQGKAMYDMITGKYSLDQTKLLSDMAKRDLIDQSEARSIMHGTGAYDNTTTKLARWKDKFADASARFEHIGRAQMALVLDNVLKDVIPDQTTRHETIMNHVTDTFVDQAREGAPLALKESPRLIQSTVSPLTRFPINDIGQLMLYAKYAGRDKTLKSFAPVMSYITTRLLLGGAASVPMVKTYNAIANFVNEKTDHEMPSTDQLLHNQPDAIVFGIPSWMTNLNLSTGAKSAADVDFPMAAGVQWMHDVYSDAFDALSGDHNSQANLLKTVAPKGLNQLIEYGRAERYKNDLAEKGLYPPQGDIVINKKGEQTVSADKGKLYNAASLATGLKTLTQAKAETENQIMFNLNKQFNDKKNGLYDKLYSAWERNDDDRVQETMHQITKTFVKAGIADSEKINSAIEHAFIERHLKKRLPSDTRDLLKNNSSQQYERYMLQNDQ